MERVEKMNPLAKRNVRKGAKRGLSFLLAMVMVFSVMTTPVDAFSLGGFFKKVSNAISSTVKAVQRIVDTSSSKTVYSFSELNSFTSSLFAPKDITVKLGADIYVPSNRTIASALHNVDMDMNGHTIYSDNPSQAVLISYGRTFNINGGTRGGTIVQRVNTSNGVIDMTGGDSTIKNVTIKKSGSASRVTGLDISGILANPEITFENVTFDGMTTGLNIQYGGRVVMKNSYIKNSQGDAVNIQGEYKGKNSTLNMTGGYIKYFKGNGINAGYGSEVNLKDVTVTGGTTRNRYGILAGKGSSVNLKGSTKVYSSAGGNIGVYKGYPVTIEAISSANKYSFTVVDGLDGTSPATVANVSFSGDIRSLPVYSDISRYMVRGENNKILIQNPPDQCNVTVQREWVVGKALDEIKDANYATVSVNGGAEGTSGNVAVKYDAKVTLSTTNNNPERYMFLGWYKYVGSNPKVLISENPTCQVEVFDENVTYKAEYRYMQYTITVKSNGKGSVIAKNNDTNATSSTNLICYVDETVTLTATPHDSFTVTDPVTQKQKTTTYGFNKWNDGVKDLTRTITVSKNETYIGMFKKTSQTEGTLYLGLKEVTGSTVPNGNLLLVYVGAGFEDNRMETGAAGTSVGVTGLPDGSAKMRLATQAEMDAKGKPSDATGDAKKYSGSGANYYGYQESSITASGSTGVTWTQKAADFDNCNPGYIKQAKIGDSYCWLYWCCGGFVKAAGPYVLYSYESEIKFSMDSVKIKMNPDFKPGTAGDTISSSEIIAVATGTDGKEYTLGGLKFGDESKGLDNQINYTQGDKTIALELDGITCDYDFPEATINGQQYTKLSDAIAAATASGNGETIKIVGPGVDSIDVTTPVNLAQGDKIEGYDSETVTATETSWIGVDKDGTVRLTQGTLEVDPPTDGKASVGVKDAFATTDKKIQVTTEDGGKKSEIKPLEEGTTLQISPDNNPDHIVTIDDVGGNDQTYQFDNIPSYAGEKVQISKETEFTINIPGGDDAGNTAIKTSKYNTGDTTIERDTEDGNPVITSTKEGDKVTVGDNTYVTGKNDNAEPTTYRVNPDQSAEPSVVLEKGTLGIPKDTTIKVNDTIIKNTGSTDSEGNVKGENPVQISASGEIEIPDGAGVTIDGVQIQVPAKTPMNGNTTVTLDDKGKPTIKTTGDSEVKLVDKNGKETTYQVGDYDCVLTIGDDGIPVIEDGEIRLQPGQTIKDRLGNEYRCPEDAEGPITIMTTPLVYETDDDGKPVTDEDGNPILVGGGDMSFVIPKDQGIKCKPKGSLTYQTFENPGDKDGFFNLDPTRAKDGMEADSELGLAPGKELNLSAGDKSVTVKAPESGNRGSILVDGSTGSVTLTKAGDQVIIGGKIYTAKEDNTVFIVDENGVTLSDGSAAAERGAAVNAEGLVITGGSGSDSMKVTTGTDAEGAKSTAINTTGKTEFAIAPIGKENAEINFVTGSDNHSYPVEIDGSITLPQGETITRKSGSSQIEIKAPEDADITMKPMPKPDKDEVSDGEVSPAGGLLIEVPTGKKVSIDGKTYQESTINNGREDGDAYTLPMQLVLDEKGAVVLYNGTVELDQGSDISLYDVANELANFKNTSKDGQKVQITNPGIATMPASGAMVTMGTGKNKVEFTTTEDDTQIAYTSDVCLLKRGGVSLDPKEQILVGDMVVRNTSSTGEVKVTREESLTEQGFTYTGKIEVPNGGSFELSAPGSDQAITYQSNVEGEGSAEFTINEDGNVVLPQGGIANLKDSTEKETNVQAGVAGVESIPTPEGAIFAIPAGGHIVVDGVKYTNNDADDYLVLAVNQDGKVVLVKGEVELSEGAIVYVKNADDGLVPITNNAQKSEEEEPGTESTILVSYNGVQEQLDEDDQVVSVTYPDVNIQVPDGGSVSIGKNTYDEAGTDGSGAKISMNIESDSGSTVTDGNISGDRILLENGTVNLGQDSTITINTSESSSTDAQKVLTNISEEEGTPVLIGSDGKVELPKGSGICVDGDTTIQVPADETDEYKAVVDLSNANGTIEVKLSTEDGTGTSDADKKVIINDDTYVSKENGKNLSLSIDTTKDDQIELSGESTSVGLSDGASITVGDTTVTATTDTEITVTATTPSGSSTKVPTVDIPAGGEANFKNPNKNQDIDVKVPQKSEEGSQSEQQKFTIGVDGSVSTDLKKDETVVIGGVEYTGKSESDTDNKIKVDGKTGELLEKPTSAPPTVSIDPEKFTKPNYQFKLTEGECVSVDGVVYQAATGASIVLMGNPDGNPIVKVESADSSVIIGGTTYTAASANTQFALDDKGKITLKDNGSTNPMANSSLKLSGKDSKTVNGVTYSGSTEEDSYTVTYHEDGSYVIVEDGSKLRMDLPSGSKIYVADKGALDTKDEKGAPVTETFMGPIPVTMNGGSGSIYLDKTKEGQTDTAFIQVLGLKDVDVQYTTDEETGDKTLTAITINQKSIYVPTTGADTGKDENKEEQKVSSIPVTGDTVESKVEIPVVVEKDKIVVDTITIDVVEKLINTEAEGTKVVALDCTALEKATVVLDVPTVENMTEKADQIKIITASAEIEIDKKATDAILEQATGEKIEIKVNAEEKEILNQAQQETLQNYQVKSCLEAFVESNGTRIHDFKGGKVKVAIPWEIEKGRKAVYYHVYYLNEQGVMEIYETLYAAGKLCFETDHFSEYVVVYDDEFLNVTPVDETPLLASVTKVGKTSLKLEWKPVEGAQKYVIYAAKCNTVLKTYKLKKVATVSASKTTYDLKNLKAGTKYKILVKPLGDGDNLNKSLVLRVTTKGGRYNNASDISIQQKKVVLSAGKSKTLKLTYIANSKSVKVGSVVQFVSSNPEIATVSKKGKIRAKRAGICNVYAILSNGEYAAVEVTVK